MKLLILDRDGVINEDSDDYIKSAEEWIPISGSLEAIARFNRAGYTVVVATNQSGIARGYFDVETLHAMHVKMEKLLDQLGGHVDGVFFCPHSPRDQCECRKPNTGLLKEIARRYQYDLHEAIMVGDSLKDIQAAKATGARAILVRSGKGENTIESNDPTLDNVPIYDNLAALADDLLTEKCL